MTVGWWVFVLVVVLAVSAFTMLACLCRAGAADDRMIERRRP